MGISANPFLSEFKFDYKQFTAICLIQRNQDAMMDSIGVDSWR